MQHKVGVSLAVEAEGDLDMKHVLVQWDGRKRFRWKVTLFIVWPFLQIWNTVKVMLVHLSLISSTEGELSNNAVLSETQPSGDFYGDSKNFFFHKCSVYELTQGKSFNL